MNDSHKKPIASYHETNGIVWMKRNIHFEFTNSKYTQTSYKHKSMELDKQASSRKDGLNDKGTEGDNSEESSYEEGYSDQDIQLNDEDVWDDSLLIKMYEASQKQINEELTKRFTGKTCDSSNEEANVSSATARSGNKKSKHMLNHSKKTTLKAHSDNKPSLSKPLNWKEGDYCQLAYLEDNVNYEAQILSINVSEQTCLVRYIGYENEEVRNLGDLKLSEGEKVRKLQIEMAIQDGYCKTDPTTDGQQQASCSFNLSHANLPELPKQMPGQASAGPASGTSRIIPPPPPFLNDIAHNMANNAGALGEDEDDELASMLMSWYMTGYHTGYYQARKDMKNNNR